MNLLAVSEVLAPTHPPPHSPPLELHAPTCEGIVHSRSHQPAIRCVPSWKTTTICAMFVRRLRIVHPEIKHEKSRFFRTHSWRGFLVSELGL